MRSFIMFPRLGLEAAARQVNMETFYSCRRELVERAVRTLHRAHSLSILTLFIIMNFKTSPSTLQTVCVPLSSARPPASANCYQAAESLQLTVLTGNYLGFSPGFKMQGWT